MTLPALTLSAPLHRLDALSRAWGLDLWAKRDDLIPEFLGGNKVRKVHRILSHALASGARPNLLITNGGAESNHARVVALMGARLGLQTHLVLHGDAPAADDMGGNSYFQRAAGARISYVESDAIAPTIAAVVEEAERAGQRVLVIPGGGHDPQGVEAYADAVRELPFMPDIIVHASGTGGTQAGLIAGVTRLGTGTRVIGISVARARERGVEAIRELLPPNTPGEAVILDDAHRFGGYGRHSPELIAFIAEVARLEGIPLDPTYTGKAMFGLRELAATQAGLAGRRVVFWHTGGLLNLHATRTEA
ncbi:pyridoxal-phosphate dependent enzyme (plasmid) [Sphingobium yanoikuyae]|uniref:Pyridoxal-phosphate dependent enzyme n=1 Tax=Sphingobium yanoikuyae TaxID=13690 RepID=A0A6P1GPZ0_SPHYA|nr:pyridoxal-phosphate dependent enzyme [Sphingobium yanoikuyae]QHD70726.1 pyridoxal-phosphate dependent enzyme [Sphingobium yanoikuyae]